MKKLILFVSLLVTSLVSTFAYATQAALLLLFAAFLQVSRTMKKLTLLVSLLVTSLVSTFAYATGSAPDFSTLTGAIDFSTAIAAMLSLFAALVGVGIVVAGGGLIVSKVFSRGK